MTNVVAIEDVRRAVEGADRGFDSGERGGGRPPPGPPPESNAPRRCPVTCLGHLAGRFYFLDAVGQGRDLVARALGNKQELLALFRGDDTWLKEMFPKRIQVKRKDEQGQEFTEDATVDFLVNWTATYLMRHCFEAGLYGDHLVLRRPGVWPDGAGLPAVHCGDSVRIAGVWHDAGHRMPMQEGKITVWAAASPVQRPATPCEGAIAQQLQDDIQALFRFRQPGAPIVVMGILATSYFGAAAEWRPSAFLTGPAGCGKSNLASVLRNASPMHSYSNDTSKAGLIGAVSGRAMLCVIDENEKSDDSPGRAARTLMDLVLTSSGGEGTQGVRGNVDGTFRRIEMVGSFIMAATAVPEMRDTHAGRIAVVDMEAPAPGEDFRVEHKALAEKTKVIAARLWARALGAWERYQASLAVFRQALQHAGCQPREMDQLGAILAGWWILTREGAPNAKGAGEGVAALAGFVRSAEIVAEDNNARRLAQYLMTSAIMLDRSSARETIASLINRILDDSLKMESFIDDSVGVATRALATHGVRVITATADKDNRGRAVPRLGPNGIWLNDKATMLRQIFDGSDWAGGRWITGLLELPTARRALAQLKVGGVTCRAIWVSIDDLGLQDVEMEASTGPP